MAEQEQDNQQGAEPQRKRGDFVLLIGSFRNGKTNTELTKQLDKLAQAVLATGKKGTQSITITMEEDDEESGRLAVSIDSVIKPPRVPRTEYRYAKKGSGELVEDNPEMDAMLSRGIFENGGE